MAVNITIIIIKIKLSLFYFGFALCVLPKNGCICPGDNLIISCTAFATADEVTVWKGTVFDCEDRNNKITLIHNRFMSPGGTSKDCNNGAIVAQSIGVEDNLYSSQLNVTVTDDMAGKTIMCLTANASDQMIQFSTTIMIGMKAKLLFPVHVTN